MVAVHVHAVAQVEEVGVAPHPGGQVDVETIERPQRLEPPVLQPQHGGEHVRTIQVTEVVERQVGTAPGGHYRPHQVLAADLAKDQGAAVTPGTILVHRRPGEVVVPFHPGRTQVGEQRLQGELVLLVEKLQLQVAGAGDGGALPGSGHRGEHEPDRRVVQEGLAQAQDAVAGERLGQPVFLAAVCAAYPGMGGPGDRLQQPQRQPAQVAGQLGRSPDTRGGRLVDQFLAVGQFRLAGRAADAAGVEQLGGVHVPEARQLEQGHVLEEEGALFRKVGLDGGKVEYHLVDFHLPEIGVGRQGEHEIAAQLQAGIGTGVEGAGAGVAVGGGIEGAPQDQVGRQVQVVGIHRRQVEAGKPTEAGHPATTVGRNVLPVIPLVEAGHPALELDAEADLGRGFETQQVQGNAHLHVPAPRGNAHCGGPHPVPVLALLAVVEPQPVHLHPGGVDGEEVAVAPVVAGIDVHLEPVGFDPAIAPGHRGQDEIGPGVVQAGEYVQGPVVVQRADLRSQAGRLPRVGISLDHTRGGRGQLPGGIVEPAVDDRCPLGPAGDDLPALPAAVATTIAGPNRKPRQQHHQSGHHPNHRFHPHSLPPAANTMP